VQEVMKNIERYRDILSPEFIHWYDKPKFRTIELKCQIQNQMSEDFCSKPSSIGLFSTYESQKKANSS
jgi:hypothetical protein